MAYVVDRPLYGKPKEKFWISYIKQRISKNKNFLGFISGQTGSGKSFSSLRIGEELDPQFDMNRVVFNGRELMSLINSGELRKGSVIVFEEVGVAMNNKNWQTTTNKMLNYLLQTFRHRNFILIMNSPFMDFVDASMRKLFHAELRTVGIDFNAKQVRLKPHLIQYNSRIKKFYYKRLKVITSKGKVPVDFWKVDMPSKELRVAYEEKKTAFTDKLNKEILEELEAVEHKKERKEKKELTDNQEEILGYLKEGMTIDQIAVVRQRTRETIESAMRLMKKKGYDFKAVLGGLTNRKAIRYDVIEPDNDQNAQYSGDIPTHIRSSPHSTQMEEKQ